MKSILCSVLFVIASVSVAMAQGTFTQIDVPGAAQTFANGINSAGDVVGSYVNPDFSEHGFILSGGLYATIDYPGAEQTVLTGINNNGQIVGFTVYPGVGFLYSIATNSFSVITVPGTSVYTYPLAINDAGIIAGCFTHKGGCPSASPKPQVTGFELEGNQYTRIAAFPNNNSQVTGITASGKLVGYTVTDRGFMISNFIFDGTSYNVISIPTGTTDTRILGVNPSGTASVGFYEDPSTFVFLGFVYEAKILTTLQFPGGTGTVATGVNHSGEVVGYFFDAAGNTDGFLWTPPAE